MMSPRFDRAYWLGRAAEARAVAAQFTNRDSKRIMLGIAEGYDQLARTAERSEPPRKDRVQAAGRVVPS